MRRRNFLTYYTAAAMGGSSLPVIAAQSEPLKIVSISKETLWRNRDGQSRTWFHPRACMLPGAAGGARSLMTLQEIGGSDYFGQVHWSTSDDQGKNWTDPQPIEAFGREAVDGHEGLRAAVCDVTPQYHRPTGSVLALGHVVFYRGRVFCQEGAAFEVPRVCHSLSWRGLVEPQDPRVGRSSRQAHLYQQLRPTCCHAQWRCANVIHLWTPGGEPDGCRCASGL